MRWLAPVAVLAVMLGGARGADADCGGGGDDDDDSSTSWDTWSDDGTSSSASVAPTCHDTTDIVGYRECTKFGAWNKTMRLPILIFEAGVNVQRFANPLKSGSGSFEHEGEEFAYRVSTPPSVGAATDEAMAVVSTVRAGVGSRSGLYSVGEREIGALVKDDSRIEMTTTGQFGKPELERTSAVAFGLLGAVGFQRTTGSLLLGAELAGGVRAVSYQYHSQYLSCEQTNSIVKARGVLEARARAAMWVSPVLGIGAQVGKSLVDERDWQVGLFVGGYTRSFAGVR